MSRPTDAPSESLKIEDLLELPTSRLEELAIQLQELEEQFLQIRYEQSKYRALISPFYKLPIEILQEIFIACLPTAHNHLMSRWEPPILLTQICSSWRNVAHATPQLWKSIHIAGPYRRLPGSPHYFLNFLSTTIEHDPRLEAVVEWLTRSAAYPLDISVGHSISNDDDWFYYRTIDSLIQFSEKWREIRLSAPYEALLPIASLPLSKVPLLEALSLKCHVNFIELDPQWISSGVVNAPNLRDLGLWSTFRNLDIVQLPINWSQLTNISLEDSPSSLSIKRAYKLLSLCRNLITCRMHIGNFTDYNEPLETNATPISLPFLTRLAVCEALATAASRLFTLLHLPSLKCIEFQSTVQRTEQSSTSLLPLLTRFHNTIQLITDARSYTRQDFIKCLRLCPLLKSLHFREPYRWENPLDIPPFKVDDAFVKLFFQPSNDEGYLCPHLEDFECSVDTTFSETSLLQFVKEKNADSPTSTGLAKLKHLFVASNFVLYSDIKQELEPYEQAGLVASLTYGLTSAPRSTFGGLPGFSRAGLFLKSASLITLESFWPPAIFY